MKDEEGRYFRDTEIQLIRALISYFKWEGSITEKAFFITQSFELSWEAMVQKFLNNNLWGYNTTTNEMLFRSGCRVHAFRKVKANIESKEKNKYFTVGLIFICILYFCLNGYTALVPLFVQGVAHYSPSVSAMIIFPGALLMILCNIVAPVLVGKIGIKKVLIIACCLSIIGHSSMMFYTAESSVLFMTITQMFRLVGAGFALMPATTWSLTMVSDRVEDGTAVNNTLRQK